MLLSNAKPARRQNVKRNKKATAQSVASDLGADWLYEDSSSAHNPNAQGERLQKVLAKAGVASRRHAEVLIEAGRVEVNGDRSEEHMSELQSRGHLVCRLLLDKKKMAMLKLTQIKLSNSH